ncbi:DUF5107 domain-containing protein [Amycolatopsis nigrescens]|uniref:DUF5107 domain-containing protein n=1 Tax=Amycolatopsis nigrescens TaxID=381445 RepID=UPI0003662394|nr:DUF5107 domain-containing protein [Amycolatopsis nigrescens]
MSTAQRTSLSVEGLRLPAAELGRENPLPPLLPPEKAQRVSNLAELPADLAGNLTYGKLDSVLPCLVQDGYRRERVESELPALVLENELLRATVLPSLGGRLYSLVDKVAGRELLYRNPVFQPANLALRGAWFAGGVEWNLGSTGHTTLTCEPLHAAGLAAPDGSPMLRLWEWERTRNLVYQLDFWLPPGSAWLFVGVRVRNPRDHAAGEVPLYWWSNIAVPRAAATRVLAPAEKAWHYGYGGRLDLVDVPGEPDLTYPAGHQQAADFFFDLPAGTPPWIAALDGDGYGPAQLSTGRLRGRKLFVWGESAGGHRWQDWLAPGAGGYLEIQAGLAKTQLEHLRLPGGESRDWLEAYGPVRADPASVHSGDWATATGSVLLPHEELARRHVEWRAVADTEPGETLHRGSGWGALELARTGEAAPPGTPFPAETLGAQQESWLQLLAGRQPHADPLLPPPGTLVAPEWRALLEKTADDWLSWYHRGVARWYDGDRSGAVAAWRSSDECAGNPWALRNLAVATGDSADLDESADLYVAALAFASDVRALAVEAVTAVLAAGRAVQAAELVEYLPPEIRADGRIRLLTARARLALGDAEGALAIFEQGFDVPDVREGETALSDVWVEIQHRLGRNLALPRRYDFRMTG